MAERAALVQHLLGIFLRHYRFQGFVQLLDIPVLRSAHETMEYDERAVRIFLKGYPDQFVSARVISRRLGGKRRYHDDPLWVLPILNSLVDKGMVETDAQAHFRLKRADPADRRNRTWISPQTRRILERSSRDFAKVITIDEDEDDLV